MSHLLDTASDRLDVPGQPGLWVEFKREPSFLDGLTIEQQRREIEARSDLSYPAQVVEFVIAKAAVMITAWNLTDADGAVLPLGASSVLGLRGDVIGFLGDEAARRLMGRPAEKEAPFEKRSQRSSRRARG